MSKIVNVKNTVIGEGMPKICVSMVSETISDLIVEAEFLKEQRIDIVEWRVDFFNDSLKRDKVKEALIEISKVLGDKPLIFTLRTSKEGGKKDIDTKYYMEINREVIETKLIDIVDIELFNDEKDVKKLIDEAHKNNIFVIVSNHDFYKTPSKEEIINRLIKAYKLGADIPKIAVMPNTAEDVITLIDASRIAKEKYIDAPIIAISMSGKGVISRLSGELFGSAVTFGATNNSSAPGQVQVETLREIIELLHSSM
ncbi:type I 3-dehydroquinate dehydratase [Clostridium sp. YIM B02515]|uniref:3-dehydroquinate dehydratase n=1 Tax=Clostridium rhizosphaerae TaxID=2803861 RepID=A0ABS1TIC9_9CLOT|nr:type I 3-dehydroquinate dehydratase [Clostridium rhizosphaerae]MBL4938361.1 type I 3-dehydroquinate dehydratase [Clostridium rhizosphaerae]